MTAAPFTPEQAAKLAAFDAAPALAETSPMTVAMLALAEELEAEWAITAVGAGIDPTVFADVWRSNAAARIRRTIAAVLAADPDPREAVVERMARAIHVEQNRGASWHLAAGYIRDEYLRLAAAALDASQGGAA